MTPATVERLVGWRHAFDHPVTVIIVVGLLALLAVTPLVIAGLARTDIVNADVRRELWRRYFSWLVLLPPMVGSVLLGAAWFMAAVAVLSLACYREYARATGLFREKTVSLLVVVAILAVTFAVADNWYYLFVALFPLATGTIAALPVLSDRPPGYVQRVALGVFGFMLFGSALGHAGYLANDPGYRPVVLLVLVAVVISDVATYVCGRLFGRRRLVPNTSPNRTVGGALGAVLFTTPLVAVGMHFVFPGTPLDTPARLAVLGLLVGVLGQFGALILSSIKRDLGLKDMGVVIPGYGGLLDRFDGLILVAPAVFHYLNYFVGVGVGQPVCVFSGARVGP